MTATNHEEIFYVPPDQLELAGALEAAQAQTGVPAESLAILAGQPHPDSVRVLTDRLSGPAPGPAHLAAAAALANYGRIEQ